MVRYGKVWYGMVWYGMVRYGTVRYGMVWHGMAWYGMVWCGVVWYGIETVHAQPQPKQQYTFANITCRLRCGENHIVRTIASDIHTLRTADR
jgi:hypothetical protein